VDRVAVTGRIRFMGGAAFRAKVGTVSVTWPFVTTMLDDWGVKVDIRPRLLRKLFVRVLADGAASPTVLWAADWASFESFEVARRSVVLRASSPTPGSCRLTMLGSQTLQQLKASAERHGVPVRPVRTTLRWYLGPR